jgi:hypothetical protein
LLIFPASSTITASTQGFDADHPGNRCDLGPKQCHYRRITRNILGPTVRNVSEVPKIRSLRLFDDSFKVEPGFFVYFLINPLSFALIVACCASAGHHVAVMEGQPRRSLPDPDAPSQRWLQLAGSYQSQEVTAARLQKGEQKSWKPAFLRKIFERVALPVLFDECSGRQGDIGPFERSKGCY